MTTMTSGELKARFNPAKNLTLIEWPFCIVILNRHTTLRRGDNDMLGYTDFLTSYVSSRLNIRVNLRRNMPIQEY